LRRFLIGALIAGIASPTGAVIACMVVILAYAIAAVVIQPFLDPLARNAEIGTGTLVANYR